MVAAKQTPYITRQEYLERERRAETKSEYHDGVIIAMAGANRQHDRIVVSLISNLNNQLQNAACEPRSSDTRIYVPTCNRYFYPDVSVVCSEVEYEDAEEDTLLNPRVIFEVLSDSTERMDRRLKADCYRTLPSLTIYVLVSQDEPRMEILTPQPDDAWRMDVVKGINAVLDLPIIGCQLRLADVYARVRFTSDIEATLETDTLS